MAFDKSDFFRRTAQSPTRFAVVTPSDSADLPFAPRFFALPAAGALAVIGTDDGDTSQTIPAGVLAPGVLHPGSFRRILATGTDAGITSVLIAV